MPVLDVAPAVSVPGLVQGRVVAPSAKVTEPVGADRPVTPVTVAVNVSADAYPAGEAPVVSVTATEGVALVMVSATTGVDGPAARYVGSVPGTYVEVIWCDPIERVEMVHVAVLLVVLF